MRKIIRQVLLEALGVPEGVLESSEKLYDVLLKKFKILSNEDELNDDYRYQLKTNLKIVDLKIGRAHV